MTLESSDKNEGIYEVLDDRRTRMYVTRLDEDWVQVFLERE